MATATVGATSWVLWLQVPRGFGYEDYAKVVRLRHGVMFVDMLEKFVMWKMYLQKLTI